MTFDTLDAVAVEMAVVGHGITVIYFMLNTKFGLHFEAQENLIRSLAKV